MRYETRVLHQAESYETSDQAYRAKNGQCFDAIKIRTAAFFIFRNCKTVLPQRISFEADSLHFSLAQKLKLTEYKNVGRN